MGSTGGGLVRTKLASGAGRWTSVDDFHRETLPLDGPRMGDFNGDGRQDLVFHRFSPNGELRIRVMHSSGSGTFTAREETHGDNRSDGPLIGDINGDGRDDLVFYSYTVLESGELGRGWRFRTKLPRGDGTWAVGLQDFHTGALPFEGPRMGDVNGDGRQDLVFHFFDAEVGLFIQAKHSNGNGTFGAFRDIHVDSRSDGLLIGDINGDGSDDLVLYSHLDDPECGSGWRFRTKFPRGDGTWAVGIEEFHTEAAPFEEPRMGDFNGDGRQDLLFFRFQPVGAREEGNQAGHQQGSPK